MSETGAAEIEVDDTYCGRCLVCPALCPYEAIAIDSASGEVSIDPEKCQFCGICYSACPVNAIEIAYYDFDKLAEMVRRKAVEEKADTLVLMCRGNSPASCEVEAILKAGDKSRFIPLRVPCVGRVPPEFVLRTLASGMSRIVAIRCEEGFCRFKQGSEINNRRLLLTKQVLRSLGFQDEALEILTYARKTVYDTEKCVGCDKCVFICPYEAIGAESLATPKVDLDKCVGCGACALVCPHQAIQLEGFEYENMSRRIHCYGEAAKKLKASKAPTVLAFVCQWSEFPALDQPEARLFDNRVMLMEIPCFKGLDPFLVVEALYAGFDGVIAVVCSDVDCKLEEGYDVAERNATVLRQTLKELSLQDRFELYTASPRKAGGFEGHLSKFLQKLTSLPESVGRAPATVDNR